MSRFQSNTDLSDRKILANSAPVQVERQAPSANTRNYDLVVSLSPSLAVEMDRRALSETVTPPGPKGRHG